MAGIFAAAELFRCQYPTAAPNLAEFYTGHLHCQRIVILYESAININRQVHKTGR